LEELAYASIDYNINNNTPRITTVINKKDPNFIKNSTTINEFSINASVNSINSRFLSAKVSTNADIQERLNNR
jgi:hypothetical protein